MRVLITGGTGTLGSKTVRELQQNNHTVRIFSRRSEPPGDLSKVEWSIGDISTGEGLAPALAKVDAVLHAASNPGFKSNKVDVQGTQNLIRVMQQSDVRHILYPSIVGIDQIEYFYYQKKLKAEGLIEQCGIPYTILRVTQFHELVATVLSAAGKVPFVLPIPTDFQLQTVAAAEVAREFCKYLNDGPAGHAPDFAGPEILTSREMAETWLRVHGKNKFVVNLPLWGDVAKGFRQRKVTNPDQSRGKVTWEEWLQERDK